VPSRRDELARTLVEEVLAGEYVRRTFNQRLPPELLLHPCQTGRTPFAAPGALARAPVYFSCRRTTRPATFSDDAAAGDTLDRVIASV